jgi:hypothetical protein
LDDKRGAFFQKCKKMFADWILYLATFASVLCIGIVALVFGATVATLLGSAFIAGVFAVWAHTRKRRHSSVQVPPSTAANSGHRTRIRSTPSVSRNTVPCRLVADAPSVLRKGTQLPESLGAVNSESRKSGVGNDVAEQVLHEAIDSLAEGSMAIHAPHVETEAAVVEQSIGIPDQGSEPPVLSQICPPGFSLSEETTNSDRSQNALASPGPVPPEPADIVLVTSTSCSLPQETALVSSDLREFGLEPNYGASVSSQDAESLESFSLGNEEEPGIQDYSGAMLIAPEGSASSQPTISVPTCLPAAPQLPSMAENGEGFAVNASPPSSGPTCEHVPLPIIDLVSKETPKAAIESSGSADAAQEIIDLCVANEPPHRGSLA